VTSYTTAFDDIVTFRPIRRGISIIICTPCSPRSTYIILYLSSWRRVKSVRRRNNVRRHRALYNILLKSYFRIILQVQAMLQNASFILCHCCGCGCCCCCCCVQDILFLYMAVVEVWTQVHTQASGFEIDLSKSKIIN